MEVIRRVPECIAVAYCDPSANARDEACALTPGVPVFVTLEEAITAVSADAVLLATPPNTREHHIDLACEHRLPMLIEKPLALDIREASRMVSKAEAAEVPLMVGMNFRYLAVTQRARELLDSDTLGKPAFARFTYERWRDGMLARLNKYPLTMTQPMLWEQSIHHFDLMRFVYASEPYTVYCRTWNPSWSMYADDSNVSAIFTFEDGLTVNYQGTWQGNWQQPNFEWRTECEEGVLIQYDQFGDLSFARREDPQPTSLPLPPHEAWITDAMGLLKAFTDAVVNDALLESSGRDHLSSLAMVEACIASSRNSCPVSVPELLASSEVIL